MENFGDRRTRGQAFKFSLGNQDPETTWKNNVLKHVGELEKEWAAKDKTKKKKS